MSFWMKVKNWRNYLIGWLGGYSQEEMNVERAMYSKDTHKLSERIVLLQNRCYNLRSRIEKLDGITAQAEITYPAGMAYDDIKRIARESIVRQLGEAVYPYAQHFYLPDGRYIVTVQVSTADGDGED